MPVVHIEEKECLIVLGLSGRSDTIRMTVDEGEKLQVVLLSATRHLEEHMKASGKLIAPKPDISEVWEARVGVFDGGVAIQFNRAGTRVPLPLPVARELARRLGLVLEAARTGISFNLNNRTPTRTFRERPVTV